VSRARQTFRERDLTRLVKALAKAGERIARVTLDKDGKLEIIVANRDGITERSESDLDRWLGKRGRSHANAT
jgi:hypothetical protein